MKIILDPWVQRFQSEALPILVDVFQPERVILFGSRARGTARPSSDLDVILISSRFDGIPFIKRMSMVYQNVLFPKHVDYLCYTPSEFERMKQSSSVVRGAVRDALELSV